MGGKAAPVFPSPSLAHFRRGKATPKGMGGTAREEIFESSSVGILPTSTTNSTSAPREHNHIGRAYTGRSPKRELICLSAVRSWISSGHLLQRRRHSPGRRDVAAFISRDREGERDPNMGVSVCVLKMPAATERPPFPANQNNKPAPSESERAAGALRSWGNSSSGIAKTGGGGII